MAFIEKFEDREFIESELEITSFHVWKYLDGNDVFKLKELKAKDIFKNNVAKEIWLNETRQLNKLKSVTNAKEYLEVIHDSFIDDEGNYCLIYQSSDTTTSLEYFLSTIEESKTRISLFSKSKGHWLSKNQVSSITSRMILWKNILRLVEAIAILHDQDIIHRNISIKSVIYDDSEDVDDTERFSLGGFEKSLDFNKINAPIFIDEGEVIYTVHQDWSDLAKLITYILGIDDITDSTNISAKEVRVLNYLMNGKSINHTKLVDKVFLKEIIHGVIDHLSRVGSSFSSNFYIILPNLDKGFEKMREILKDYLLENMDENYDVDNITNNDVISIIKRDLNVESFKVFSLGNANSFILQGNRFLYKIRKYEHKNLDDWYVSYISEIYSRIPDWLNYKESVVIQGSLKVASNMFQLKEISFTEENSWKIKLIQFNKEKKYKAAELECLQGLLLALAIEVAVLEADKFLVNLKPVKESELQDNDSLFIDSGYFYYKLEYKKEDNLVNNKLSEVLNLKQPFDRFRSYLQNSVEEWVVEPINKLQKDIERNEKVDIQYVGKNNLMLFSSKEPLERNIYSIDTGLVLIYPKELNGQSAQINRRMNIFYSLLNQSSLISCLADPASRYTVSSQTFDSENYLDYLDLAKQEVFKSLLKTQPHYFIEGPPGVGKTHLITTYVDYLFSKEDSAKILLSAQSHATVGILYDEIIKKLIKQPFYKDLTIVTDFISDKNDNDNLTGSDTFKRTTEPYIEDFKRSDMFKKYYSDSGIKEKLDRFLKKPDFQFFNSILRGANLVFTTSNSSLMEKSVTNNINFDVSIMEECGKSSGIELISPMMVSTKRVLIGDYRQLPAFFEQHIQKIVLNPTNFDIQLVLDQLQKNGFKKSIIYDLDLSIKSIDRQSNSVYLKSLDKFFSLFKSLCISAEGIRSRGQDSFGSLINTQHRMHPEISRIISNAVYAGRLKDDEDKAKHYSETIPFYFQSSMLKDLNKNNALIWVDIPDKNSKLGIKQFENNNTNQAEISIIKEILTKIRSNCEKQYSIRVLSPYKNQVSMINKIIDVSKIDNCFKDSLESQDLAQTVDSFQGDQADVIIISLVRHNSHQPITSALGFLTDMRRMNVLLSRAKYKMIIVGCFSLFEKWQRLETNEQNNCRGYLKQSDKEFLDNFIDIFKNDFELMKNESISLDEKNFTNANFIQASSFLEI